MIADALKSLNIMLVIDRAVNCIALTQNFHKMKPGGNTIKVNILT